MNSPFDYQILKLTDAFYNTYSKEEYPELLLNLEDLIIVFSLNLITGILFVFRLGQIYVIKMHFYLRIQKDLKNMHQAWIIQK